MLDSPQGSSHVSTAKKIHADVARVALQRVHADWIEFPVLASPDKVGVAWKRSRKRVSRGGKRAQWRGDRAIPTVNVPERGVHVVGDPAPVLHASRVGRFHAVLVGAEPPVAARPEEVGVVGGVVAPAQGRLDPRRRQTQRPDGLRPPDLPLGVKHPVVVTCREREGRYGLSQEPRASARPLTDPERLKHQPYRRVHAPQSGSA